MLIQRTKAMMIRCAYDTKAKVTLANFRQNEEAINQM